MLKHKIKLYLGNGFWGRKNVFTFINNILIYCL